jgi:sporulation protein YlmC with PRC-barrel domain
MTRARDFLLMTTAAALCAAPLVAFGQANTGGSSQAPTTTQTMPQQGPLSGTPGTASRTDGTPGNPPSTATQRAADAVTGNRTSPDGTGNNPPGTAAGRAIDRAIDRATGGTTAQTDTTTPRALPPAVVAPGAPATGSTAGTPPFGTTTTGTTTPSMAVDSARLQGGRRASKLIGSNIYNENNESIGEVDDIIVPPGGGQPVAVLSVGGFLGIGARLIAVPYERLQWNAERDRWTLQGATRDSVRGLPEYRYEEERRRG